MNLVQPRLPRSGLGHSLFSYGRAWCYFAEGNAEFVHPNWFKIRVGPYVRRERDKRNYHLLVRTPREWGLPWHSCARRIWMRTVAEADFDPSGSGQFLLVRNDLSLHSQTIRLLVPHRKRFARALESISRFPVLGRQADAVPSIGIFHRSGDVRTVRPDSRDERVLRTHGYGYFPPEWAAEALRKIRDIAGWRVPAVLSTEAPPSEVAPILEEGGVTMSRTQSALVNMLEMRHHPVLIMGSSSFPFWSWFLGDSFAITPLHWEKVHPSADLPSERRGWFVFDCETSLNDQVDRDAIRGRLPRP